MLVVRKWVEILEEKKGKKAAKAVVVDKAFPQPEMKETVTKMRDGTTNRMEMLQKRRQEG